MDPDPSKIPFSADEFLEDERTTIPNIMNSLAACRVCALVKSYGQFEDFGCNNCTKAGIWNPGDSGQMTTPSFSGIIAMLKPSESWVAKYQLMKKNYEPGLYAIQVPDRITAQEAVHGFDE